MSLERAENIDTANAKTIKLGEREFTVLPLSLRQIMAIADKVPKLRGIDAANINAENIRIFADVVTNGLKRAYPQITEDDILDLPMTMADLAGAATIVVEQAGGRKVDDAAGERPATSSGSTPSTGESSSQN